MRFVALLVVLVVTACGGGRAKRATPSGVAARGASASPQPVPQTPGAPNAASFVARGTVHEVRMLLTSDGKYLFDPAAITITVGDVVRWRDVSGGPHDVAFHPDQIPSGAAPILNAAMSDKVGELQGKILFADGDTYDISFAGLPPGTYNYYCLPHEPMGMKGVITVER